MDVQHMATVVHLWLERRTGCDVDYESLLEASVVKITKYRQIRSLLMTSFRACPTKLFSLHFLTE
jgi:hypothetical protein